MTLSERVPSARGSSTGNLDISERTVKAHLGRVFRRLGVSDRTSAAPWGLEHLAPEAGPDA